MFYTGYHFMGMNLVWWCVWGILLFWIFVTPYRVPGERRAKDKPLDILQKRYAAGEINAEEYNERKGNLESDLPA